MNTYLDELIRSVEAEIIAERTVVAASEGRIARTRSGLNRMLQRLATLEALRKSEAMRTREQLPRRREPRHRPVGSDRHCSARERF